MKEISTIEFELLKKLLFRISGIDIQENKRYLFTTRLGEYLEEKGYSGFSEFYNRLTSGKEPELQREFVQAMTTHESSFFRDSRPFTLLTKHLLPEIADSSRENARLLRPHLRILSAGCSLGQETYTIAMCVRSWLDTQQDFTEKDITVLGIDISRRVLERARRGTYTRNEIGMAVPVAIFDKLFNKESDGTFTVVEPVRTMVRFQEHNLVEPITALGKFDILFCRNVIIYFPVDLQKKILDHFHRQLNRYGALIMGASETTYNLCDSFEVVSLGNTAYFKPVST
ncbi:MAG: protein-glutamate O-methyltransferase CheR [Chitinispirillaceae bacterium]|nr:protein-glutamate O-methyltransferase CheR [Chitinispirillaceae bacterium]